MINIELDEKSVFTYNAESMTVHLWDHRDGKWEGPVIGRTGQIKFADEDQIYHFMEMLEFMLQKCEVIKTENDRQISRQNT